ncbi:MAG: hemolysin family protein [Armatimonadota bacterium]|nr:hemolysin family protein [Armatimonadota bacterium]MDR5696449.1 hemolysin family protein [Armatimonadota bacterium]
MDSWTPVAVIAGLILLNGVFVAAEFAIVGAPRARIQYRAALGHRLARRVWDVLQDPQRQDRYVATAQLGITFASIGLGMYGEHVVADWLAEVFGSLGAGRWIAAHTVGSATAVVLLTYLHIVLGEMVPKALALQRAEQTAYWVTPLMGWLRTALYPLVAGLNGAGNSVLRLLGIRRQAATHHYYTPEELLYVVQESAEGGVLQRESGRMLRELFEFGDRTAAEVMVPRVRIVGIPIGATSQEISAILRAQPHTRYPVYRGDLDHVVGMVHIKDLLRLYGGRRSLELPDVRSVPFVPQTATLTAVLAAMRRARTQIAIVIDEHGGTSGLVTVEDLFEEVVGDIEESGGRRPDIYEDDTGRVRAAGTARLDEVGERFGRVLEHEEVDTVSGLVLALLGRPPAVGDAVTYDGLRFEVLAVKGYGVEECAIRRVDAEEGSR